MSVVRYDTMGIRRTLWIFALIGCSLLLQQSSSLSKQYFRQGEGQAREQQTDTKGMGQTKNSQQQNGRLESAKLKNQSIQPGSVEKASHHVGTNPPSWGQGGHVATRSSSSSATVMGMATGMQLQPLKQFVGSLRRTGYLGNIILGVEEGASTSVLSYFSEQNVTPKIIQYSNCTFRPFYKEGSTAMKKALASDVRGLTVCAKRYPDVKLRWVKYPLGRDWLRGCPTCTGPVLLTDVRDVYFQRDPFAEGPNAIKGLQVFEEHASQTTEHWLVGPLVKKCKGVRLRKPMLCSGTTIGTLEAMVNYLDRMYEEMRVWIEKRKCRFKSVADDQAIHNWLFYSGALANAVAVKNREGIVNTVGVDGSRVLNAHKKKFTEMGVAEREAANIPYPAKAGAWISSQQYELTNDKGEFINFDGTVSAVVHQWDRFGLPLIKWLKTQGL